MSLHSTNVQPTFKMRTAEQIHSTFPLDVTARLAQSVEHETLNLRVVGSSPTLGAPFMIFFLYANFEQLDVWCFHNHLGAVA